jgi:hypothetical protein
MGLHLIASPNFNFLKKLLSYSPRATLSALLIAVPCAGNPIIMFFRSARPLAQRPQVEQFTFLSSLPGIVAGQVKIVFPAGVMVNLFVVPFGRMQTTGAMFSACFASASLRLSADRLIVKPARLAHSKYGRVVVVMLHSRYCDSITSPIIPKR